MQSILVSSLNSTQEAHEEESVVLRPAAVAAAAENERFLNLIVLLLLLLLLLLSPSLARSVNVSDIYPSSLQLNFCCSMIRS